MGVVAVDSRTAAAGLMSAVVEAWSPHGAHSYGLLLEDDIEVSPYYHLYLKQSLLRYVYAAVAEGGGGGVPPPYLLGYSLYTPRLVEVAHAAERGGRLAAQGRRRPRRRALPA